MPRHSNETFSDTHLDAKEVVGGFLWGRFPGRWRDGTRDATVSARLSPSSDGLYDSRKHHFWCGSPMCWVLTTSFHCQLNSQNKETIQGIVSPGLTKIYWSELSHSECSIYTDSSRDATRCSVANAHTVYTRWLYTKLCVYTQHTSVHDIIIQTVYRIKSVLAIGRESDCFYCWFSTTGIADVSLCINFILFFCNFCVEKHLYLTQTLKFSITVCMLWPRWEAAS